MKNMTFKKITSQALSSDLLPCAGIVGKYHHDTELFCD